MSRLIVLVVEHDVGSPDALPRQAYHFNTTKVFRVPHQFVVNPYLKAYSRVGELAPPNSKSTS